MYKILLVLLFISQAGVAKGLDNSSMERAVGRYKLAVGSSEECVSPDYKVKFYSSKKPVFGKECGSVLWMASETDPMGLFFCRADLAVEHKTIGLNLFNEAGEAPDFVIADAGKIDNESVQHVVPAEGNDPNLFSVPNVKSADVRSVKAVFTITPAGFDIKQSAILKTGATVKISTCSYVRRSK